MLSLSKEEIEKINDLYSEVSGVADEVALSNISLEDKLDGLLNYSQDNGFDFSSQIDLIEHILNN